MKKINKKVKGMTLIEMIISIAIFAMLGLILVTAANCISAHMKGARNLNEKVAVQGPIAESQNVNGAKEIDKDLTITVANADDPSITAAVLTAKLYDTADIEEITDSNGQPVTDAAGNIQYTTVDSNVMNGGLNFKFVTEVETIPQPTT